MKKDIATELNYATEADCYTVSIAARQAVWSEPYFDVGGAGESVLMMTYSMPLYDTNREHPNCANVAHKLEEQGSRGAGENRFKFFLAPVHPNIFAKTGCTPPISN